MKHTEEIFIVQSMVAKGFFYGTIMDRDSEDISTAKEILDFVKLAQDFMMETPESSFELVEKKFIEIRKDFEEWCHEREKETALFFDNFQLIIDSNYKNIPEKKTDISKFMNMDNEISEGK